jgi:uncharacterized cupredoxin-like copper-binding protein
MKKAEVTIGLALGLILLSSCAGAPQTVEVQLTEFGIESSVMEFTPGRTYTFVISNGGALVHEFAITARGAGAQAEHHDAQELHHDMSGSFLHIGQEHLPPGESATIEYTFPREIVGELEFACHLEGHYEAGMVTPISLDGS